jgi:ABC-2 type transport system ATP-binding protein
MMVLSANAVGYRYGSRMALANVSFDVRAGRVTMLLGPNGAGKSTLFSLISRLLAMQGGTLTLVDRDVAAASDDILAHLGVVFQQSALDLDLTVEQNLRYFAGLHGLSHTAADTAVADVLVRFELVARRKDRVRALNGGHRRRVEIGRAFMTRPKLLLLDEPTVGLDMPTRKSLVETLHQLAITENLAVLWATHLADEVWPEDDLVVLVDGVTTATGPCQALLDAAKVPSVDAYFALLARKVAV